MIVFSAAQAVSPAIERTRHLLFRPFRLGTFLKLCTIAVFTEGFGGNFNFSGPSHSTTEHTHTSTFLSGTAFVWTPGWIALLAAVVVLSVVLSLALFYLMTRLRFALFYSLAYQVKEIRPGWRLYREPANRFFKLNLVVGLAFLFVVLLSVAPFAFGFFRMFKETQAGAHFDILLFVSLFLPVLALLFVIIFAAVAIDIVLRDFMLPHFALEDLSAGAAWREVRARIAAEKGSFFVYGLLRIFLPFAAMFALLLVLAIPTLLVVAIVVAVFSGVHLILPSSEAMRILLGVVVGLVAFTLALLLGICFGGPLSIWIRNFALVFYGGRFPLLGNVLFPPPPPALFAAGDAPTL
ncbi:MAG TPA: hypothetical protein VHW46_14520 [Terracidiphilus sp.]|jgi:hypothetical protein|nr:hypothetical protein [Terracidiphilus sp.]